MPANRALRRARGVRAAFGHGLSRQSIHLTINQLQLEIAFLRELASNLLILDRRI
jgi:hypothetical protein